MTIWCNVELDETARALLRQGVGGHRLVVHTGQNATPMRDAPNIPPADSEILFGQPDPGFLVGVNEVRWLHLSSAGFTRYDREDVRSALAQRGIVLTNSSHVFDEPCAQHLAAMILALARRLPACHDNQRGARTWFQNDPGHRNCRLVNGQTAIIYGFGAIARRLVELLAPWGMKLFAVRRTPRGDEGISVLSEGEADARLGEADHVIDILPHNGGTVGFFGRERIRRFKAGARFYNIGRGATVDQDALAEALRNGQLDAAYLDVTDPEPLPPDHALWSAPHCHITPHIGGAHIGEDGRLVRHFLANLARFDKGEPLENRVF